MTILAWGKKVSAAFRQKLVAGAVTLGVQPDDLMACMAFESAESFSPAIRNAAGSGAIGLIQFMPQTAAALGTSTAALAAMTAEEQLDCVFKYFRPRAGRLANLGDIYMDILWPAGIGKSDDFVLFDRADTAHPALYVQNRGLDYNANGQITRGECLIQVRSKLQRGLLPQYRWVD